MSEYFYFKGQIKPFKTEIDKVRAELLSTEYLKGRDDRLNNSGDDLILDTIGMYGSAPLSLNQEFVSKLNDIQKYLDRESVIEHYVESGYGNSYSHIYLTPGASELKIEKISDKDPYSQKFSNEDLLTLLKAQYPEAQNIIDAYYKIIIEKLLEGKTVQTDIGSLRIQIGQKPAREGRNPQTGGKMLMPSKTYKMITLSGDKEDWVRDQLK